jgi:hypothetical protein
MSLFLEVCGDRPIDGYARTDGDKFRSTLRKVPKDYRKSPKDREKTLAQIIAEADAKGAPRIGEKTVKRHFWALSQFFVFLMETGRLPKSAENPGRGFSFNTKGSARINARRGVCRMLAGQREMGEHSRRLRPIWAMPFSGQPPESGL